MAEVQIDNLGDWLYHLRSYFPLKDNESVIALFADQLESCEPNLAILSLVCGYIEHHLTCKTSNLKDVFPVMDFSSFCQIYEEYRKLLRQRSNKYDLRAKSSSCDNEICKKLDKLDNRSQKEYCSDRCDSEVSETSRKIIKNISDFVWGQLSTSYFKDRPHIQNLYSFLNGEIL